MVGLEANMGPHTNDKNSWGLTWARRIFGNEPDRKNMLRGHENEECTDDQLVLLGHGIYPNAYLISKRTNFDMEKVADLNAIANCARRIVRVE